MVLQAHKHIPPQSFKALCIFCPASRISRAHHCPRQPLQRKIRLRRPDSVYGWSTWRKLLSGRLASFALRSCEAMQEIFSCCLPDSSLLRPECLPLLLYGHARRTRVPVRLLESRLRAHTSAWVNLTDRRPIRVRCPIPGLATSLVSERI